MQTDSLKLSEGPTIPGSDPRKRCGGFQRTSLRTRPLNARSVREPCSDLLSLFRTMGRLGVATREPNAMGSNLRSGKNVGSKGLLQDAEIYAMTLMIDHRGPKTATRPRSGNLMIRSIVSEAIQWSAMQLRPVRKLVRSRPPDHRPQPTSKVGSEPNGRRRIVADQRPGGWLYPILADCFRVSIQENKFALRR